MWRIGRAVFPREAWEDLGTGPLCHNSLPTLRDSKEHKLQSRETQ